MYAHIANNNSDLSSFAAKNDISLNLTDAEFTFTSTGTANVYAVYNENKKVYLTNESDANSFFSASSKK